MARSIQEGQENFLETIIDYKLQYYCWDAAMYVSVTGLQVRGPLGFLLFLLRTLPAFRAAQNADGNVFCEAKTRNKTHHTLTVWESKVHMQTYRSSSPHLKAMKAFSKIGSGRVYGYESDTIPDWESALKAYDLYGRNV